MKVKVKVKGDLPKGKSCTFVVCEDPKTGALHLKRGKDCPKEMVKRYNKCAREKGVILPREDDDE